jgi:hypothetical protein
MITILTEREGEIKDDVCIVMLEHMDKLSL